MFGEIVSGISNYLGAKMNADATKDASQMNADLQREFAQNGIRWKVADAKAAGIHPLYALGAQTVAASPSYIGDSSMGNALADIGQNVGRAISATSTRSERAKQEQLSALQLERASLENDLLRSQITSVNRSNTPAMPPTSNSEMPLLTGQGDSYPSMGILPPPLVDEKPLSRTHSEPGNPAKEVGAVTDYGFVRTPTGLAVVPSQDVKQRIEDQLIPELMWAYRNQAKPFWKGLPAPDARLYPPPPGYSAWEWNPYEQEFQPSRYRRSPRGFGDRFRDFIDSVRRMPNP